ncbi:23S rRNA (pseudouridine(1915)-N(3))-methyltransferase RlmH [bacterium]|nr:23S rRNA (pseudouridine(1915)-N(3))-methyltransferase RlmH [bacterium]
MKIKILLVGKPTNPHYAALAQEYCRRIGRYLDIALETVPAQKLDQPVGHVRSQEAQRLLAKIEAKEWCVALDRTGVCLDSQQLAKKMNGWLQSGQRPLCFVIGGPIGLDEQVLHRADEKLALSAFTLAHELALVVLLEQLYRAFTLLRGEKYHK